MKILILIAVISSVVWEEVLGACTTPQGIQSTCISLYDCKPLLNAFAQRPLPSDTIEYLRKSQCGFQEHTPLVCCGNLPTSTATTSRPASRPSVTTPASLNNGGAIDSLSSEDAVPAPRGTCGVDTNGDRLYGGTLTELDEFPWMALLGYRTARGTISYQCGGVLINKRYVLTAAHCITGTITTEVGTLERVILGEYNTQQDIDCVDGVCADPPQEYNVQRAVAHPGFNDQIRSRQDDIGIVRLAKRVKYTYYVQPICLVDNNARLATGNDVFVAGWGKTLSGQNSPIKLKLSLPIFDKSDCASKYSTLNAVLNDRQICAGGVFAEDACRGDSGGPLMRRTPSGEWESVAVVSFGYGCGRDGWPGVYTSVASYRDWILQTMRSTNV